MELIVGLWGNTNRLLPNSRNEEYPKQIGHIGKQIDIPTEKLNRRNELRKILGKWKIKYLGYFVRHNTVIKNVLYC